MTDHRQLAGYLLNIGDYIKTLALEARAERDGLTRGTLEWEFQAGRVLAFIEVISILQQTAEGMSVPLKVLRLEGFDPERELL